MKTRKLFTIYDWLRGLKKCLLLALIPWEPSDLRQSCFQVEERKEERQKVVPVPEQLQDQPKPKGDELEEINMAEE